MGTSTHGCTVPCLGKFKEDKEVSRVAIFSGGGKASGGWGTSDATMIIES